MESIKSINTMTKDGRRFFAALTILTVSPHLYILGEKIVGTQLTPDEMIALVDKCASGLDFKRDIDMPGAQRIGTERWEQVYKHKWSVRNDADYKDGQLIKAALFCINSNLFEWPFGWDKKFRDKILKKSQIERYAVAGAFIAAQIDRDEYINSLPQGC